MDNAAWAGLVSVVLGIVVQTFLKAPQAVKSWVSGVALLVCGGIAFGAYALAVPPPHGPWNVWVMNGIMWAFGPAGLSSLAGQLKLLPATNSAQYVADVFTGRKPDQPTGGTK